MIPQNTTKTKSPRFLTIVKNLGQANFENHNKNSPTTPHTKVQSFLKQKEPLLRFFFYSS